MAKKLNKTIDLNNQKTINKLVDYKRLDLREIKCQCNHSKNCNGGLSFDYENYGKKFVIVVKFHDNIGKEHHIHLKEKETKKLIDSLNIRLNEIKKHNKNK